MNYTFDIPKFRQDFPEFGDPTKYTDSQINYWSGFCILQLNAVLFGNLLPFAWELYVAHELFIANKNAKAGSGNPNFGLVASKKVGDMDISYDNTPYNASNIANAGMFNASPYGKQLYDMFRRVGALVVTFSGSQKLNSTGVSVYGESPKLKFMAKEFDLSSNCNGINSIFTILNERLSGVQSLLYQGVELDIGDDYTLRQDGNNIVITLSMDAPPETGEHLIFKNNQ